MDDPWAAFVAARLDEDEADANEVHLPRCCGSTDRDGEFSPDPVWCGCGYPARVLREVAAKRALLAMAREDLAAEYEPGDGEYNEGFISASRGGASIILRHLAAAWSDHGDYPGTAVAP